MYAIYIDINIDNMNISYILNYTKCQLLFLSFRQLL